MTDALNDVYEYYVTRNTADAEALKKEMMVTSQVGQAILNISNLSNMFDYNYAAGGVISGGGSYSVPHTIVYSGSSGGAGGGSYVVSNPYLGNWPEPVDTEVLAEKIVTRYVPGSPLVICADNELTSAQMDEISAQLVRHNVEAVIIRGARAGAGRPKRSVATSSPGWRIDILARLAETWERHPDLTFAELIRWWSGENMTDDDFAAATDVYAKKVYE